MPEFGGARDNPTGRLTSQGSGHFGTVTFYPMGHGVEISTGSSNALAVAEKLWRRYPQLSDAPPVRFRIIESSDSASPPPAAEAPRVQENILSIVHGPADYAIADLATGFAFAYLSRSSLADPAYFRYYFLEPLVYMMQGARHFVFAHAACVALRGRAILLCGESGAGKTCLAFACAKRGWQFVSGDAVHIVRGASPTVIGRPYEIRFRNSSRALFPELDGFTPELRANGKMDLEIDTAQLGIETELRSRAAHVVFLERRHTPVSAYLTQEPPEEAMKTLGHTVSFFGDAGLRSSQTETLAAFLRTPAWRLHYSDTDQAEGLLRSLIETPC